MSALMWGWFWSILSGSLKFMLVQDTDTCPMGLHKHILPRWRISPWSHFQFCPLILNYIRRAHEGCNDTQLKLPFLRGWSVLHHDSPWNKAVWLGRNETPAFLALFFFFPFLAFFNGFTICYFQFLLWEVLSAKGAPCPLVLTLSESWSLEHWNAGAAGWLIAWCTGKTSPLALSRSQTKWNWLSWTLNRNSLVIWATCFSFF